MLDGRAAIVTGAASGLGRSHALALAASGAQVVVNDLDEDAAAAVVDDIGSHGGAAVVVAGDITQWETGERLVATALDTFGRIDVLVNNAGILRERMVFNTNEGDWNDVIRTHLKGTFVPTRLVTAHWRDRSKAGDGGDASLINTSSAAGLVGQVGQSAYGAAKAGIAAFSNITAHEVGRYGVRVNTIVPAARTAMTDATPALAEAFRAPDDGAFDRWDPANVSALVVCLAAADCPAHGETYFVGGGIVQRMQPWQFAERVDLGERPDAEALRRRFGELGRTEHLDIMQVTGAAG